MSTPHPWSVLHLLVADDALPEGHVYRRYLALCGVLLPTSKLPPATCPDDCELDVLYCSECVRTAAQWTAEAQRAERASENLPVSATALHEKPYGAPGEGCAALQFDRTIAQAPERIRPPRSGDDEPDGNEPAPQAWITYVGGCGHHRVMSNPAHSGPCPDCDTPDPQP